MFSQLSLRSPNATRKRRFLNNRMGEMNYESPTKLVKGNDVSTKLFTNLPPIHLPLNTPKGSSASSGTAYSNSSTQGSRSNFTTPSQWTTTSSSSPAFSVPLLSMSSFSSNTKSENQNNIHTLGEGSYWTVHENTNDPTKVIRIGISTLQKNRNVRAAAKRRSNQFLNLTKNNRNRNQEISYNQLPAYLQKQYQSYKNTIQASRMPNLGINLLTFMNQYDKKQINLFDRLPALLTQYHTLLRQTYLLSKNHMCHADIHLTNIMINPESLELHLIDFDLLDTFDQTQKRLLGDKQINSWIPPEYLYLRDQEDKLSTYIQKMYETFSEYYECHHITKDILRFMVIASNRQNKTTNKDLILYLDNFGLGMPLLQLLTILYPQCVRDSDAYDNIDHAMRDLIGTAIKPSSNTDRQIDDINRIIAGIKKDIRKLNNNNNSQMIATLRSQLKQEEAQRAPFLQQSEKEHQLWKKQIEQKEIEVEQAVMKMMNTSPPKNHMNDSASTALYHTIELLKKMVDFRISSRVTPVEAYQTMTDILVRLFATDSAKVKTIKAMYQEDVIHGGRRSNRKTRRSKK